MASAPPSPSASWWGPGFEISTGQSETKMEYFIFRVELSMGLMVNASKIEYMYFYQGQEDRNVHKGT